MNKKEATQEFMLKYCDDRINKLVDELAKEKAFNKALQVDNNRLHDLLDNSEDNVKRVSLLMSELKLNNNLTGDEK